MDKDKEILIELEDWDHTCGDGCIMGTKMVPNPKKY